MTFLRPEVLWYGWPLLLIPVAIHLFNLRRYQTLYFPNVRFLQQIQRERRIRNRLRQWLLMLLRILALAALLGAFALPVAPNTQYDADVGATSMSLFIDNSFSMASEGAEGPLYRNAQRMAHAIVDQLDANARIQVQTHAPGPRLSRFYAPNEVRDLIDGVAPGPGAEPLPDIMQRQALALRQEQAQGPRVRVVLSDFQKTITPLKAFQADTTLQTLWAPLPHQSPANLFIDTVLFSAPFVYPGQKTTCQVRIVQTGSEAVEDLSIRLRLNDQPKAVAQVDVPAEGQATAEMTFTPNATGWYRGVVSIEDAPVRFDDQYYFTFQIKPQASVLYVSQQPRRSVVSAFETDSYFKLQTTAPGQIDFGRLSEYDLVVLEAASALSGGAVDRFRQFAAGGGNLLLLPSIDVSQEEPLRTALGLPGRSEAKKATSGLQKPRVSQAFFSDIFESLPDQVDMPAVRKYFPLRQPLPYRAEVLLRLRNEAPLFFRLPLEAGQVFGFQMPLGSAWSNLEEHALFVPLFLKCALYGGGRAIYQAQVGQPEAVAAPIRPNGKDDVLALQTPSGQTLIPRQRAERNQYRVFPGEGIHEAGFYGLSRQGRSGKSDTGRAKAWMAFNYDRRESRLEAHEQDVLEEKARQLGFQWVSGAPEEVAQTAGVMTEPYMPRWRWFLVAAVGFLLGEILLTKILPQ